MQNLKTVPQSFYLGVLRMDNWNGRYNWNETTKVVSRSWQNDEGHQDHQAQVCLPELSKYSWGVE